MQYAVIATGGKQYVVNIGQSVVIEALPQAVGDVVTFDQVLLTVDGGALQIGQPMVAGMTVTGTVVEQRRGEKLRVFKYRPKSRYSRTNGHRQQETVVRIESIGDHKATSANKAEVAETPKVAKSAEAAAKPARARATRKTAEVKE